MLQLAQAVIEIVTQNGEKPGLEIGAFLKVAEAVPRTDQGFLHQIVGLRTIPAQRDRKCAQAGYGLNQRLPERGGRSGHFPSVSLLASSSSNFVKRSGIGSARSS